MDNVVKVRRSFLAELRGFCNRFVSMCDNCFRHPCDCEWADTVALAKSLIFRIDNIRDAEDEKMYCDNQKHNDFSVVLTALRQAGHPLMANEIRVCEDKGVHWRQRRHNLLAMMIRRGLIVGFVRHGDYFYSLPGWEATEENKTNQDNNTKESNHGIQP